jgi:aspartyl-tRNA(Asn)/glutamyl-tRNA(Gln) amidotransferase subunit C
MSKKITTAEVRKTAELARIELSKKEEEKFTKDLDNILSFFADIQEAQAGKVEKFDHYQLNRNSLRADEVLEKEEGLTEGIKENFPEEKDGYFKVKTVIKK